MMVETFHVKHSSSQRLFAQRSIATAQEKKRKQRELSPSASRMQCAAP
jgi:hypothetical protein